MSVPISITEPMREFRPSKRPYVVFSIIFLPQAAWTFAVFVSKDDIGALIASIGCLLFMFSLWLWIFHNRLFFCTDGVLHGRFSLFRRYLAYSEMEDFYTFIGFRDDRGRTGPFVRLVIEPKPESGKKAIIIPSRLFSVADSKNIIELLSKRLSRRKTKKRPRRLPRGTA